MVPKKEPSDPAPPVLYPPQPQEVTEEGDYVPAQTFSAVEASMPWKPSNNPTCPFGKQEPSDANVRSVKSESLMSLFFASTWGDLMVKPLLLDTKLCPNLIR